MRKYYKLVLIIFFCLRTLKLLDVSNNEIGDEGFRALSAVLATNSGLQVSILLPFVLFLISKVKYIPPL